MTKPSKKKRKIEKDQVPMAEDTPSKKHKASRAGNAPKKKLPAVKKHSKPNEIAQPKPVNREDISSNWKAFLQAASASAPTPAPARRRAGRQGAALARRGCSCPAPVWFDGVDPALLETDRQLCTFCVKQKELETRRRSKEADAEKMDTEEKERLQKARTPQASRYVAMDCEMVGVGHAGVESMLARVSIVNALCQPLYDKFVKPKERITDYRTAVSGIRPKDLTKGESFETVQAEVAALLKGRVLVGHALHNDLRALLLSHPKRHTRDTAGYKPFRKMFNGAVPSLKNLAHKILAVDIQKGEHDSVQDARATMQVYQTHRREWEAAVAERLRARRTGKTAG